jgi:hypothetical protein
MNSVSVLDIKTRIDMFDGFQISGVGEEYNRLKRLVNQRCGFGEMGLVVDEGREFDGHVKRLGLEYSKGYEEFQKVSTCA